MRIAFVALGFRPLRMSGLDSSGERLVLALLEAGHQVTVVAAARGPTQELLTCPGLQVYRLPLGRSNWIGHAYRGAQLVRQLNHARPFDVVHFWDAHFAFAYRGAFVASLHQSFRQRMSIVGHDRVKPLAWPRLLYYALAKHLAEVPSLGRAGRLMAVSAATRDEFIKNYGVAPDRITLTRHGIDTDFFHRTHQGLALREQIGLDSNEPVLLFTGFVTPRKGLDYLAQALPLIRPAPRLLIVGRWSPSYRSQFYRLLGPAARQVIECGFVPDEQMPAYYSLADVYVSTSLLEGFGLSLAESLSCETPVVASDAGAASEIIGPGGILVPPRDSASCANAISHLLANVPLRHAMGKLGREHIRREFSIPGMLESTLAAYRQFIGRA